MQTALGGMVSHAVVYVYEDDEEEEEIYEKEDAENDGNDGDTGENEDMAEEDVFFYGED